MARDLSTPRRPSTSASAPDLQAGRRAFPTPTGVAPSHEGGLAP